MATHSSNLAWKIPTTEEPGRLQSMGHKESDTSKQLSLHSWWYIKCLMLELLFNTWTYVVRFQKLQLVISLLFSTLPPPEEGEKNLTQKKIWKAFFTLNYFTKDCVGFPDGSVVRNLRAMQEMWVPRLGQEDLLEEEMQPTSVFLPEKSEGQRCLVSYSPHDWVTEHTHTKIVYYLKLVKIL